jgi:nitrogen fixation protein NifU and related proteins
MYSDLILDHFEHPRRSGTLPAPTHRGTHHNSLCGDEITLELVIRDGVIQDAAWSGQGCCLTVVGASMLAERLVGMTICAACHLEADSLLSLFGDNIPKSRQGCCLVAWNALQELEPTLR